MSIYAHVDPTTRQMEELFWSLVPVVAEQTGVADTDAFAHMRRAWIEGLRELRISNAIDYRADGRAAAWRVRLIIWRTDQNEQAQDRIADSDPRGVFETYEIDPGSTIIYGLPAVADWALDLITACHAARDAAGTIEGLSASALASRIKSLRVALSKSGGKSVWRLRYSVSTPAAEPPERLPGAPPSLSYRAGAPSPLQHFCAYVYVQREESTRHRQ